MLTICQHGRPIDQACPACRRHAHAWTHAVTCYPWEVEATEHEDEDTPQQIAADYYDYDPLHQPVGITEDEIAELLVIARWEDLLSLYEDAPDPRGEAMIRIEEDAETLYHWTYTLQQEMGE